MRTLTERMRDWRWWGEQLLHAIAGAACAALVAYWTPWWASASFGAALGILREITQNLGDESNSVGDSIADVLCWTMGAVAMSFVF